jgi:hypothetical protein
MKKDHLEKQVAAEPVKTGANAEQTASAKKSGIKIPTTLVIKRDSVVKTLVGLVAAIVLVIVLDWVIQLSITSQYAAFYKGFDISRSVYTKELEKQYGESVMQELLAKAAIVEGAKAKGISVTDDEVTTAISADKARAGITTDEDFATALAQSGLTIDEYRSYVKITVTLDKLISGDIVEPTDAELKEYFTTNSDQYTGQKFEDVKATIAADIKQMELNSKRQTWIDDTLKNYDTTNNLVIDGNKSYKFLKSVSLIDKLFSNDPNTKQ